MKTFPLPAETPLLVAVSGGKDSLALWNALHDLGYTTKGLHISLGIDDFSEASIKAVEQFAFPRNLPWVRYSLKEVTGYTIPEIKRSTRRKICSICGLLKRQLLNRLSVKEEFEALVVGHNLDDEAGRLMGNMIRNRSQYLEKQQSPFLPSTHPRLPSKLKPLYRLEALEVHHYCEAKGIKPVEKKCPLSRGATSHFFKEALHLMETRMPGTKRSFLFSYLRRKEPSGRSLPFGTCGQCGEPTYEDLCSVCNLFNQLRQKEEEHQGK